jgi:hypothetical protein
LKLERSIDNLARRLDRFDPVFPSSNKIGLNYWKGKAIIPFIDWMSIKDTQYALQYFPDDFDQDLTYIPEDGLEQGLKLEDAKIWNGIIINANSISCTNLGMLLLYNIKYVKFKESINV